MPLDAAHALAAARIGVKEGLPLADRITPATARQYDATIWTMDADFDGIAGVSFFPNRTS